MEVFSFEISSSMKRRMNRIRNIDWSEVLREAIRRRLELEERRTPMDRSRVVAAARRMDQFRAQLGRTEYDSTNEIRRWRDRREQ